MSWVYSIAFVGDKFVMVFNPKRDGWEMPGGKIEKGESAEQAAVREVREECGCDFKPFARMKHRDGTVFAGSLECPIAKLPEMEWGLFTNLPKQLAFGDDEYRETLAWAVGERGTRYSKGCFKSTID
jgi:8-oxo-dGTP diphosphatase